MAAALLLAGPSFAAPLEVYGKLPFIENIAISPDGKQLAMVVTDGENRKVVVRTLDGSKIVTGLDAGKTKIRDLQWADSGTLLITSTSTSSVTGLSNSHSEWASTKAFDIATGKLRNVLAKLRGMELNTTFGSPIIREVDGKTVVIVPGMDFARGRGRATLYRLNLTTDIPEPVVDPQLGAGPYFVDERGQPFALVSGDPVLGSWTIRVFRGRNWAVLAEGKDLINWPEIVAFGRTPGTLLVSINASDGVQLRELSIADGKWGVTLPQREVNGVLIDSRGHMIGGVATNGDQRSYTFDNPADQAAWNGIVKGYPGESVTFVGWSNDHKRILVSVESQSTLPAYAWVDLNAKSAKWISDAYKGLTAKDVSPQRPISYSATDGEIIRGYLTTPRGPDTNLPLVVLAHGGPASRDALGFDWWAQALASRGYAVLQANFRGSTGYGNAFLEAGYGQWGRKMQTDLSDGVRYLAQQGLVDPKRVCIVGASYGGYAALAGAAIDRGVYRCAASIAGISDLTRLLKTERDESGLGSFRYLKSYLGVDGVRDPKLDELSPLQQVDKVSIPVLLVHGKDDTVVKFEQSRLMADALTKAGKPVEFVTLDGEDHWLSSGVTRLKMLQAVTAFLEKNNPPG
ncbi:S9 family peptidase [soil metagenome]